MENCSCPQGYAGLSCETCADGFYRYNEICVPCNCSGLNLTCNSKSGNCLDCPENTRGKRCEACAFGMRRIKPTSSFEVCIDCNCPGPYKQRLFFAFSCETTSYRCPVHLGIYKQLMCELRLLRWRNVTPVNLPQHRQLLAHKCFCLQGHAGQHCERCSNGYYGNPPAGQICMPCDCPWENGCDANGHCLHCPPHAGGPGCRLCNPGFKRDGDRCILCPCRPCGLRGACRRCSPYDPLTGPACTSCPEAFYASGGDSCVPCECDWITARGCNAWTGQCECKRGHSGPTCNDTCTSCSQELVNALEVEPGSYSQETTPLDKFETLDVKYHYYTDLMRLKSLTAQVFLRRIVYAQIYGLALPRVDVPSPRCKQGSSLTLTKCMINTEIMWTSLSKGNTQNDMLLDEISLPHHQMKTVRETITAIIDIQARTPDMPTLHTLSNKHRLLINRTAMMNIMNMEHEEKLSENKPETVSVYMQQLARITSRHIMTKALRGDILERAKKHRNNSAENIGIIDKTQKFAVKLFYEVADYHSTMYVPIRINSRSVRNEYDRIVNRLAGVREEISGIQSDIHIAEATLNYDIARAKALLNAAVDTPASMLFNKISADIRTDISELKTNLEWEILDTEDVLVQAEKMMLRVNRTLSIANIWTGQRLRIGANCAANLSAVIPSHSYARIIRIETTLSFENPHDVIAFSLRDVRHRAGVIFEELSEFALVLKRKRFTLIHIQSSAPHYRKQVYPLLVLPRTNYTLSIYITHNEFQLSVSPNPLTSALPRRSKPGPALANTNILSSDRPRLHIQPPHLQFPDHDVTPSSGSSNTVTISAFSINGRNLRGEDFTTDDQTRGCCSIPCTKRAEAVDNADVFYSLQRDVTIPPISGEYYSVEFMFVVGTNTGPLISAANTNGTIFQATFNSHNSSLQLQVYQKTYSLAFAGSLIRQIRLTITFIKLHLTVMLSDPTDGGSQYSYNFLLDEEDLADLSTTFYVGKCYSTPTITNLIVPLKLVSPYRPIPCGAKIVGKCLEVTSTRMKKSLCMEGSPGPSFIPREATTVTLSFSFRVQFHTEILVQIDDVIVKIINGRLAVVVSNITQWKEMQKVSSMEFTPVHIKIYRNLMRLQTWDTCSRLIFAPSAFQKIQFAPDGLHGCFANILLYDKQPGIQKNNCTCIQSITRGTHFNPEDAIMLPSATTHGLQFSFRPQVRRGILLSSAIVNITYDTTGIYITGEISARYDANIRCNGAWSWIRIRIKERVVVIEHNRQKGVWLLSNKERPSYPLKVFGKGIAPFKGCVKGLQHNDKVVRLPGRSCPAQDNKF